MLLRENVYESLRSDILTCRLAPGDDMREQELAERYAVSRQPVREALLRLEREHLVTVQPRQGYRVNPISLSDARDLAHASGNRRMATALCDLIGQADRLVRVSVANVKGHDPTQLVAEHVALIEAMQRRDGRTAARIIKAHIAQTEKRVLPALRRNAVIVEGRDP